MEDYNFLADLLSTYRANPDWLKFFWLFFPAALLVLAGHGLTRLLRARMGGEEVSDLTPNDLHPRLSSPRRRGPTFPFEERGGYAGELPPAPDTPRLSSNLDMDPRLRGDDN